MQTEQIIKTAEEKLIHTYNRYQIVLDKGDGVRLYDTDGKDLNATANGSFYTLYTRLGVDVQGPKLGRAKTSAKVEMDFRGSGTTFSTVRLRHAYLNLDWGKPSLLLGQTWHPLYGDVAPQILNLNMGAPFQPFSRAPQIRYRYKTGDIQITGAALWQSQYLSQGPEGKSQKYIKNSSGKEPEYASASLPEPLFPVASRREKVRLPQAFFALKASAYIRICFTIASRPLLRVGDKCSFRPIFSIKYKSLFNISSGVCPDTTLISKVTIPFTIKASLSALKTILPSTSSA